MPSALRRTQHRAVSLTRSLATAIKFKVFADETESCSPFTEPSIVPKYDISRPRRLRRAPNPMSNHVHFIHRLPIELLAHVFVLGSEDDVMFPVRISHVCHHWRQTALHTPRLWRRIVLSSNIDMWKERISRAGACTLDIQLLSRRLMQFPASQRQYLDSMVVQWYLYPITPLLRRWRSFEVVFTDYSPYLWNAALSRLCSRGMRIQAPVLQDLTLVYRVNDDTKEFCLFSGHAPSLRNATLDGIRLTWLPSLFGNLTFLDYTHHGFSVGHQAIYDVVTMLEVSSRLVEFRILFPPKSCLVPHSRSSPVTRRVVLQSLECLHLRVEGTDIPFELAHLMTVVLTPSLTSLSLIDVDHRRPTFPGLDSFFDAYPISPSLRFLHIEYRWYDPRMVPPIVSTLSHLRRIVVRRAQMPDQVLDVAYRHRKARWMCDFIQQDSCHMGHIFAPALGHRSTDSCVH